MAELKAKKAKSNAERDMELILKAQDGDMLARDQLLEHYRPTMRYFAKKRVFGDYLEDAVQSVAIRVLTSIERYEPERGAVSTFLIRQIMFGLSDFLRDLAPRSVRRKQEIADRKVGLRVFQRNASIDQLRGNGDGDYQYTFLESLADEGCDYDWKVLEDEDDFDHLLRSLREPMRTVIDLRFRHDKTMQEIGEAVGCSESRISQMLSAELPILGLRLRRIADGACLPTAAR